MTSEQAPTAGIEADEVAAEIEQAYRDGYDEGKSEWSGVQTQLWHAMQTWLLRHGLLEHSDHDGYTVSDILDGLAEVEGENKRCRELLRKNAAQIATLEDQVRSARADAWQSIETLPNAERLIMAYCPPDEAFPDGRMMNWRASMLFDQFARIARGIPQPSHLSFPATHWREMPAPPALNPPESSNAAS